VAGACQGRRLSPLHPPLPPVRSEGAHPGRPRIRVGVSSEREPQGDRRRATAVRRHRGRLPGRVRGRRATRVGRTADGLVRASDLAVRACGPPGPRRCPAPSPYGPDVPGSAALRQAQGGRGVGPRPTVLTLPNLATLNNACKQDAQDMQDELRANSRRPLTSCPSCLSCSMALTLPGSTPRCRTWTRNLLCAPRVTAPGAVSSTAAPVRSSPAPPRHSAAAGRSAHRR